MKKLLMPTAVAVLAVAFLMGSHLPTPTTVNVLGDLNSEMGCSADNDPNCTQARLAYDAEDDVWQATFSLPAGDFGYKAALDGAPAGSFGRYGVPGGGNAPISLTATTPVKFYYDHRTHWIADNKNQVIAVAAGNFQSELGCAADWKENCLRAWLQDENGDGIYTFTTTALPSGNYEMKVTIGESWSESYGVGGGNANIPFSVSGLGQEVTFRYDSVTHVPTVTVGPRLVIFPGTFQQASGCAGDWLADCTITRATYDPETDLYRLTLPLNAGSYQYKVALNGNWDVDYGRYGQFKGANVPTTLPSTTSVTFLYDHKSHYMTDTVRTTPVVAVGDFQTILGCDDTFDASCLRTWLVDITEGNGPAEYESEPLPPGTYNAKVTVGPDTYGAAAADGSGCGVLNSPHNQRFTVPPGRARKVFFTYDSTTHCMQFLVGGRPKGNLSLAKAHWLTPDTVAWKLDEAPPAGSTAALVHSPTGGMAITPSGVSGGQAVAMTYLPAGLPAALRAKFPHLAGLYAFQINGGAPANIKDILKGEVAVQLVGSDGIIVDGTSVRAPAVLDALYADGAKLVSLGATWSAGIPTLRVWAPTAQDVKLELYDDPTTSTAAEQAMTLDPNTGVWSAAGNSTWKDKYYQFKVTVFTRATRTVVTNFVQDPYSVDVSVNSTRSRLADLADPALKPAGWDAMAKPALASPLDIVLYELHIRDFSINDTTADAAHRGRYQAFTDTNSDGMKHLRALAEAGVTHVHLLPAFDIASVDEDSTTWEPVDYVTLRGQAADSEDQQDYAEMHRDDDGFNWGYDPLLFGAPEGSYATNPSGGARVKEFREMVMGLNGIGLRAVMDVVYNHTNSSGQDSKSVLDRIVPGYYHRLNADGLIERSTCCENTATEHAMMAKLTVDTLVTWAREYKVSGFRFDLMGHMPKDVILAARTALVAVDPNIYLYGEGWNFGEVENNKQFVQAKQADMAGTGVGTFNDRVRDAVRGGSPFSAITDQGFASGLFTDPNEAAASVGASAQRRKLVTTSDLIRIGLAGNLKTFSLLDASGKQVTGEQLSYNGAPGAGYTAAPQENISYVSAHDNMTLFDYIQVKSPSGADLAARIRSNNLALAIVLLSQGIPFFHAGDEILRSKSGDTNSYNSGDWFNRIDWSLETHTWGSGLPPSTDNATNWPTLKPLLARANIKPAKADMQFALGVFKDFLRLRKAEPLFRMRTAQEIQEHIRFHNVGANQVPGLIVMGISANADGNPADGDLMVIFNGSPNPQSFQSSEFTGRHYELHPVLASGTDEVVKTAAYKPLTGQFTVPGRTAAVFKQTPGQSPLLPEQADPTCACSTSGANAALGLFALALVTLWRRRRPARSPQTW